MSRWYRRFFAVISIASLLACKIASKKSEGDSATQTPADSGSTAKDLKQSFPTNGTIIADYDKLGGKTQLLSVANPSGSPISQVSSAKASGGSGLALFSGAPLSGSILDSMGNEIAQVRGKEANEVFLTVDRSGNFAIVLYVNSTIGYMFPSNGDLASCFSVVAPIGKQALPFLDCVDLGPATSLITNQTRYSNGQYIRDGANLYYQDGRRVTDGASFYYSTGNTLKSGSSFYWANGRSMGSSYLYYPSGSTLYSSYLYYENGDTFANTSSAYYDVSGDLKYNGRFYYPDDRTIYDGYSYYYPNGQTLRSSGGTLYTESGVSSQAQVSFARSYSDGNVYVNARPNSAWLGVVYLDSRTTHETALMAQFPDGAFIGKDTPGVSAPPSPANLYVSSKTETSVNVDWTSNGGTTTRFIVRQILRPVSFLPNCVGGTETSSTSFNFTGLEPGSMYAFLVCSVNGEGTYSPAAIVLEMSGNPVPPPINVVVTPPTGLSASVSWQSADSSVASFVVKTAISPTIPTNCVGGTGIGNVSTYTFNNLEENARYYFAICSANSAGAQSTPTIVAATTPPVPPPEVTGISSRSLIPNQMLLSWTSGGGTTSRWLVERSSANTIPGPCTTNSTAFTTAFATYAGLTANTEYVFRICGQTKNGTISAGAVYTGRTIAPAVNGLQLGGAFGSINRGVNNVVNPATAAATCPAGYAVYKFIDNPGFDYESSYCFARPETVTQPRYDFGGMIGSINGAVIPNPAGGVAACPSGYSEIQILSTAGVDAALKLCYKSHVANTNQDLLFGGIFGFVNGVAVVNPATGDMNCPAGFVKTKVYGNATPRDYDVNMCQKSTLPTPPNVTSLNSSATPAYQSTQLTWTSGGGNVANYLVAYAIGNTAPADCSQGRVVGNVTTYQLAGLNPATTYSVRICSANSFLGYSAGVTKTFTTAPVPSGYSNSLDFGGMYGSINGAYNNALNPATNAATCPTGYTAQKFIDRPGYDYSATFCYRSVANGAETFYDFGGVIGSVNGGPVVNPMTNANTCPTGYTAKQVLGHSNVDTNLSFCYRPHVIGRLPDALFGGMVGSVNGVNQNNPVTGAYSCPTGYNAKQVLGRPLASGVHYGDPNVIICYRVLTPPANEPTGLNASSITATTASLNWTASSNANGYMVKVAPGSVAPTSCDGGTLVATGVTNALTGLVPATVYSARVCSLNTLQAPSVGITATFTTAVAPIPPNPTGLTATVLNANSIRLNWVSGAGITTGFFVARAEGATAPASCVGATSVGNVLTYTVPNLRAAMQYSFRVCSTSATTAQSAGVTVSATTSAIVYAINSGGAAVAPFTADANFAGGGTFSTSSAITLTGLVNPAPMAVYQKQRSSTTVYTFPGLEVGKNYKLRMHFAELYWNNANYRRFNVLANGVVIVSNLDVLAAAGGKNKGLIREATVLPDSTGKIVISFANLANIAIINGVEVIIVR
ncbi:MAG: fibronectin type III domain-containing protein [Proteobacteria bacterium]|nr:fibronectin type III domain-containing protein [Pseudomonadota bacterium]